MTDELTKLRDKKLATDALGYLLDSKVMLEVAHAGLMKYKKYKPISWVINDVQSNINVIESYIKRCQKIIKEQNNDN